MEDLKKPRIELTTAVIALIGVALGLLTAGITIAINVTQKAPKIVSFKVLPSPEKELGEDSVILDWQVDGWQTKPLLNGKQVPLDDSERFPIPRDGRLRLVAQGSFMGWEWGGEEKEIRVGPTQGVKIASLPNSPVIEPPPKLKPDDPVPPRPNPDDTVPQPPSPAPKAEGYVTLTSNFKDSVMDVPSIGKFVGEVHDRPVPPGDYTISASREAMKPQSLPLTVAAGQHVAIDVEFAPDETYLLDQLRQAEQEAQYRNFPNAVKRAKAVLVLDPRNRDAHTVLSLAYYRDGNMPDFATAAADALDAGAPIYIELLDRDRSSQAPLHVATVTVTNSGLSFKADAIGPGCDLPTSPVPWAQVESIEVTRDKANQVWLDLKVHPKGPASSASEVKLWQLGSKIVKMQVKHGILLTTDDVVVSPRQGSIRILDTVADVLRRAKGTSK